MQGHAQPGGTIQDSPSEKSPPVHSGDYEAGFKAGFQDRAAYMQEEKRLMLMHLVGGIRIHVKDGESAGAVALRVVEIAEKVWQYGEERGFIEKPETE